MFCTIWFAETVGWPIWQYLLDKLCVVCFKHYLLVSLFQFVLYIHQCWLDPTSCLSQIYHLLLLKLLVISFFLCLFCVKMTVFNQNWLILIEIFRKLKIILFRNLCFSGLNLPLAGLIWKIKSNISTFSKKILRNVR